MLLATIALFTALFILSAREQDIVAREELERRNAASIRIGARRAELNAAWKF